MKKDKIIYWISTGILSLLFTFSALMYLTNYERAAGFFVNLGYPTYLIYPLAILKILALLTILTRKSNFLKELAFSGLLFDAILALIAHLMVGDGEFPGAVIATVVICISWVYDRRVFGSYIQSLTNLKKS